MINALEPMMKTQVKIAPSLLAADFGRLADEIRKVEDGGCDMLHIDVMDGRFVPNISVGPVVVRAVRRLTRLPLCAHLMIEEPWNYIPAFADAGADEIIVHEEACGTRLSATLQIIKKSVKACGVSIRPSTPVSAIRGVLETVDTALLMTVNPGFGGQKFMPEVLPKIRELRAIYPKDIAVDGGINFETAKQVTQAGANVLIAGTAIFTNSNPKNAIKELRCR